MPPPEPNIVELTLALNHVGKVFDTFVKELRTVQASVPAMTAGKTSASTAGNRQLLDQYGNPYQPAASHSPVPPDNARQPGAVGPNASRVVRRVVGGKRDLAQEAQEYDAWTQQHPNASPIAWDAAARYWSEHSGQIKPRELFGSDLSLREKLTVARQGVGGQLGDHATEFTSKRKEEWDKANLFEKYYIAQSTLRTAGHAVRSMASHSPLGPGSALGYSQEGVNVGPWQVPIANLATEAGRKGVSEWAKRKWIAWKTPGLGTGDIGEIQGALYKQGWVEGGARNRMFDAMVDVKKRYKGMDSDLMASMMDQGTRYGTGTVNDMVGILKKIPDAAHAAGLSMNEMVDAINQVANSSQKQGATYKQGAAFGLQALTTTGRDPRLAQQLSENPFVQSRIMAQTGILPQAQGALDPNQRLNLGNKSLREQYNIYRGMRSVPVKDPLTGKTHTVSGEAQALAMTADATGLSVDAVKSQLKDERRQALFNNLLTHTRYSSTDAASAANRGDWARADKELLETTQIDKMQRQGIISGKQASDIWHVTAEAVQKADKESDPEKRKALLKAAGTEKLRRLSTIAKDSTKDQIQQGAGKDRVQITLTGKAEKFFKVLSENTHTTWDDAKGIAQAGGEVLLQGAPNLGKLVENQAASILGFGD